MSKTIKHKMGEWWKLNHFYTVYPQDGGYFFKVWLVDTSGDPHTECHRMKKYDGYEQAVDACNAWLRVNKVYATYIPAKRNLAV